MSIRVKKSVLRIADDLVSNDRQKQYGHPAQNFRDIALIASAITGKDFTAEDCVKILIATKLGRLKFQFKTDSLVDLAGYVKVWELVRTHQKRIESHKVIIKQDKVNRR